MKEKEGAVLGVNVGHPIVTNAVRSSDAALPKLLRDFLFIMTVLSGAGERMGQD